MVTGHKANRGTEGRNPLARDLDCLLPYPSDFFRVDGQIRIEGPSSTNNRGKRRFQGLDAGGFPVYPSIMFAVPKPITSLLIPTLSTVIIHAESGV